MSDDQVTTDQSEQIKVKMYLQDQNFNREREMMAMDRQRRTNLLNHYIETIDIAIKHIKELEGLS